MALCKCNCGQEVGEGKEFVNGGHYARWQAQQKREEILKQIPKIGVEDEQGKTTVIANPNASKLKRFWNWFIGKNQPEKIPFFYKKPELEPKKETPTVEQEKEKFLRFFANLPEWSKHKPPFFTELLIKLANPKMDIKTVIFADDDAKVKVAYLPYNEEFGYFTTNRGLYELPVKGKFAIMHVESLLPLLQAKPRPPDYEFNSDYNLTIANVFLAQGRLKQFEELIKTVMKWQQNDKIAKILIFAILIFLMYEMYMFQSTNTYLAQQVNNLSRAVHP